MEASMQCWIEECLGWHPGTATVDGVEVVTAYCPHHAALRQHAVWALNPCSYVEARRGQPCGCPPGEPWGACAAVRARYLPLALTGCLARAGELEALRALAATEGAANVAAGPRVAAPERLVVLPAGEHARMPLSHASRRQRRTGLTTA